MRPSTRTSFTVIEHGRNVGLTAAYNNVACFETSPRALCTHLLNRLNRRGAQLLAVECSSGIVSWFDAGMGFVAMPGYLDKAPAAHGSRISLSVGIWHGIVYGNARMRPSKDGACLYLHLVGREIDSTKEVLSDGSCERSLFREISTSLKRKPVAVPVIEFQVDRGLPPVELQGERTYARAFASHFRKLPEISPVDVRQNGLSKVYPAPFDEVWAACLDVTFQYTAMADVSVSEGLIVFAHQIALPEKIIGMKVQPVDVLMVLRAEPRGARGSSVHVALLSDPGLSVSPIPDLKEEHADEVLAKLRSTPTKLAAAVIADELFGYLATQLFYEERWKEMLKRRFHGENTQED